MKTLITSILLCCASASLAQTDMTSWITDPDFEQEGRSVWKTNSFGRQTNSDFSLKHGTAYREVWSGGTAGDAYIYQDLSNMPVGTYTLTVAAQNIKQSDLNMVCEGAWIYANDEKTDVNKTADYSVTCVVKDGNLRIGAQIESCTGNYVCIDNFRLSYQLIYADVKDYLEQLVASVDEVDQKNTSDERTEMISARDALKALMDAEQSEGMDQAVKRLEAAILNYRYSIASAENPMDMTEVVSDANLESGANGWTLTNMGTQTNSDFPGKVGTTYAEKWSGSGGVEDCSMKQTLTNLPSGRYRLTAISWNVLQSNTSAKQTGCYLTLDNTKTEISTLDTYTVEAVTPANQITIGWACINATGNYCCVDNFKLYYLGSDPTAEQKAFEEQITIAEDMLGLEMNTSVRETLQKAIDQAKAVTGTEGRGEASIALNEAIEQATSSYAIYVQLDKVIKKGQDALAEAKPNGTEKLQQAINSALSMKASGNIDADMVATAESMIDEGIFAYRVLNGTGTAPQVTTFPTVIVGGNAMCGRLTASGSGIIERGFCWAENPNPTVLDSHSSNYQTCNETGNQPVYLMYGVKASTQYWVRAYALTSTYAVGYGEPIRVWTLPQGTTEYTFLWNGDDEHNQWLDNAMQEATAYYNTWTAIKGFHPTANYSPGTETADCSYGGWINVGPWRCNTGTMVHEMMHGTGVGQHWRYWDSNLHGGDNGIDWLGERGNRITNFFEPGYVCNGDGIHICFQGNGNDMQQIRSCCLMQAMYEDGLPAVSDGACPFYAYESIDSVKYYITNEAKDMNSRYLMENESGKLIYKSVADVTELQDDSYAWNLIYEPLTALYYIRNAKTGKYFTYNGSTFTLKESEDASKVEKIQLMPCRYNKTFKEGTEEFNVKPYWFARGNRDITPAVLIMTSASSGATGGESLDFANSSTTQHWIIYTADEINRIAQAQGSISKERLNRLIEGTKVLMESPHEQTDETADATMSTNLTAMEARRDTLISASQLTNAVSDMYGYLLTYLPKIKALDEKHPMDITFMMDDPNLETGSNWEGMTADSVGSTLQYTSSFSLMQSLPYKMPNGTYAFYARAFERPGERTAVAKDYYKNNVNNVTAVLTFNKKTQTLKNICEGGRSEKLNEGGIELKSQGYYLPTNMKAAQAYIEDGRYNNVIFFALGIRSYLTFGISNDTDVDQDWTVIDGFELKYYGTGWKTADLETAVEAVPSTQTALPAGYYTLSGTRLSAPLEHGVTLVRHTDGTTSKVMKK